MLVLVLDIVAALLWDRLMLLIFAPKILRASVEGTTWKDVVNALKVMAICYGVIYFLATVGCGFSTLAATIACCDTGMSISGRPLDRKARDCSVKEV